MVSSPSKSNCTGSSRSRCFQINKSTGEDRHMDVMVFIVSLRTVYVAKDNKDKDDTFGGHSTLIQYA